MGGQEQGRRGKPLMDVTLAGADLDLTPRGALEHEFHHGAGLLLRQRDGFSKSCVDQSLSPIFSESGAAPFG